MGLQRRRNERYINTHLKKIPNILNSEPVQSLPRPYDSYPKVARNQPKPRNSVIARYLPKPPEVQSVLRPFERPKLVRNEKVSKFAKVVLNSLESEEGYDVVARSLPTFAEIEFNITSKGKPTGVETTKFVNQPEYNVLKTKKIPKEKSIDLQCLPKRLQYHRRVDANIKTNSKSNKNPTEKPELLQYPISSKIKTSDRDIEKIINKSKKILSKVKTPDVIQALPPKQSAEFKKIQGKSKKIPAFKSYRLPKGTDIEYQEHIDFQELWARNPTDVDHSLPTLPYVGALRSILKTSMNYAQVKKLDEDSLQRITEGKGPVNECICNLLSSSVTKEKGIKASIKRAFASLSGGKKRGGGGQNSADIPLTFTQGGKGGMYTKKEVLKRKSPCGKCGCDKGPVVMKHSYANIRITSPDLSTLCSCPDDCFPDKNKYNGMVKVTVERLALNSDDSELSLHKRTQETAIPEPLMGVNMDDRSCSDRSEWSSGN